MDILNKINIPSLRDPVGESVWVGQRDLWGAAHQVVVSWTPDTIVMQKRLEINGQEQVGASFVFEKKNIQWRLTSFSGYACEEKPKTREIIDYINKEKEDLVLQGSTPKHKKMFG